MNTATATPLLHPTERYAGTLANPGVRLYLCLAASAQASADKLYAMYMRMYAHKDGEGEGDGNAIWDGYWSLKQDAHRLVVELRNRGGLLFFGSCAATAIASAKQMGEAA